MKCKNCGEDMSGDGYTAALHCPDTDASDREPDADPLHCGAPDDKPSAARPSAPTVALKKPAIEAEYHRQVRAAGVEPRLMHFDAFISGVRFAERVHGIGKEGGT